MLVGTITPPPKTQPRSSLKKKFRSSISEAVTGVVKGLLILRNVFYKKFIKFLSFPLLYLLIY